VALLSHCPRSAQRVFDELIALEELESVPDLGFARLKGESNRGKVRPKRLLTVVYNWLRLVFGESSSKLLDHKPQSENCVALIKCGGALFDVKARNQPCHTFDVSAS
jgi:hypothetical protein